MKTGLLWLDDDPGRTLAEKVERARWAYWHKHGKQPNTCYVHSLALDGDSERQVGGVHVLADTTILRCHFWMGVEDEEA